MKKRSYIKLYFLLLSVGLSLVAVQAENSPLTATLESATVYFSGAELKHSLSTTLSSGENTIVIKNLSPQLDESSLVISASNGAVISSFEFKTEDVMDSKAIPLKLKQWNDSINIYDDKIAETNNLKQVNEQVLTLMNNQGEQSGSGVTSNFADLIKYADYLKTKSVEIYAEQRKYDKQLTNLKTAKNRLLNKVREATTQNSTRMGVLTIQLMSPKATSSNFDIKYYTPDAGWQPYYDIRMASLTSPVDITTKAKVAQTTGLDWKKIKVSLSSSAPVKGGKAPVLNPWFVDHKEANPEGNWFIGLGPTANMYFGPNDQHASFLDRMTTNPNLQISGNTSLVAQKKTSSPLYIVDGLPVSKDVYSQINPQMIKSVDKLTSANATALYGSQASAGAIVVTTKTSANDFVNQTDTDMGQMLDIDMPYTILGNGKEQTIVLKEQSIESEFSFYTAPKKSINVYLIAEISNWQTLGLMSGKANVSYAGTYMGETFISSNSTDDKLRLTLGTDDRVSVKRTKLQDYSSKKFLGSDIKQEFMYQIAVQNNRPQAIKLVVEDQYPISQDQSIKVELTKDMTKPSLTNEATGVWTWKIDLEAGESENIKLGYSVKYPKDKDLNL